MSSLSSQDVSLASIECVRCAKSFSSVSCFKNELLKGDAYFQYICASCNDGKSDTCIRDPITWPVIIHLVLYNLSIQFPEKKFFKMKEDICALLLVYWDDVIPHKSSKSIVQK